MIAIQLQLLFSACLVTRPLLPHTFPVPLSPKVDGFVWWLAVKGELWPTASIWKCRMFMVVFSSP